MHTLPKLITPSSYQVSGAISAVKTCMLRWTSYDGQFEMFKRVLALCFFVSPMKCKPLIVRSTVKTPSSLDL